MRKSFLLGVVFCLAFSVIGWTQVDESHVAEHISSPSMQSMSPPKILWIYREEVKPARGASHEKVESGYARLWEKAGTQPYIGLDALSGSNESVFVSGYSSFAALEKDQKIFNDVSTGPLKGEHEALAAQEAGLINGTRSSIAVLQPELSYLSDRFSDKLAKSRYMQVESFQVLPGKDQHFVDGAKLYQEAYRKLNIQDPWLVYRVISGNDSGTYLVFASMNSMADLDDQMTIESRMQEAMGEQMKNLMQSSGEAFASMHTNTYSINPMTSHPPKEFAALNPSFWTKPAGSGEDRVLARTDFPSNPDVIRKVQGALNNRGYTCGSADGVAGSQTKSALRRFQKENGLTATGEIDRKTTQKLGL